MTGFTNVEVLADRQMVGIAQRGRPSIKRVAFIFDPKFAPDGGSYYTRLIEASAASFAVVPTATPVHEAVEIERSVREIVREPNGGLIVLPDPTTWSSRLIIALVAQHRMPAIYCSLTGRGRRLDILWC